VVESAEPVADEADAGDDTSAETTEAKPAAKSKTSAAPKQATAKAPGAKDARAAVPKQTKAQAKAPVRRSAPRGKG
jgi:hypothetical protein